MLTYLTNMFKLARSDRQLNPKLAIYYVTEQCNLNCTYCEDFGARRNTNNFGWLPVDQVLRILSIIRSGTDCLMLTGGEPLIHPEIDQIIHEAKNKLNFREVTLISNGSLLNLHEKAIECIDRLIISLDTLEPQQFSKIIQGSSVTAESIIENIRKFSTLQSRLKFQMIINCVLTPETLPGIEALLEFCLQNHLLVSFSPQAVNNWPRYELLVSVEYKDLIQKIEHYKRSGGPVFASDSYLRMLTNFQPYDCYPTLAPRIYSNGDLSYPCRPIEKANNGQGGRSVNLLEIGSWSDAWEIAQKNFGQPPRSCHSCFQQCYAEPSLMQSQPLAMLQEQIHYSSSHAGNLSTYSPG